MTKNCISHPNHSAFSGIQCNNNFITLDQQFNGPIRDFLCTSKIFYKMLIMALKHGHC